MRHEQPEIEFGSVIEAWGRLLTTAKAGILPFVTVGGN